jgi:hypothetical protein
MLKFIGKTKVFFSEIGQKLRLNFKCSEKDTVISYTFIWVKFPPLLRFISYKSLLLLVTIIKCTPQIKIRAKFQILPAET